MPTEDLEYYTMRVGEPLTAEEKAEIAALKGRPIVYDEDERIPRTLQESRRRLKFCRQQKKTVRRNFSGG